MLHYVLHVPKLACYLLSICKISKNANCSVVFYESHSTFQDQDLRETIVLVKMIGGFYYFREVSVNHKIAQGFDSVCSSALQETIMLCFFYLKHLFPNLFKVLDCSIFNEISCIFSKHRRSTTLQGLPFYIIHTDVWGLYKVDP